MGLEELSSMAKTVLEDIQRQINEKSEVLIQRSEEVKRLQKTALNLEKQMPILDSEIESKQMVIANLDKKIQYKATQAEIDVAPLRNELKNKIEQADQNLRTILLREGAFQDQYKMYQEESKELDIKHGLLKKDRDYIDQQMLTLAEMRYKHDSEVAKYNDNLKQLESREEIAHNTMREVAVKKAEYEALILKNKDIENIYKNKENALVGWEARNRNVEVEISHRLEAIEKEEARVKKIREDAIAQEGGVSAKRKDLDLYKKNLDNKAQELKYMEARFKQLATQKGIAEELERMGK